MGSFELFVDLLYVGIIAVVGDAAAEDATGLGLLRFAVTFVLGWKMWSDLTLIVSWFETNGICPFQSKPIRFNCKQRFTNQRVFVLVMRIMSQIRASIL